MKLNTIYFLFLLFLSTSFSQTVDTARTKSVTLADTSQTKTITFSDSTKIILRDSTLTDSSAIFSTSKPDTVIPLFQQPLSPFSTFISRKEILQTDYQYSADLLKLFPFTFVNELGLYGHPENVSIYGIPSLQVSFMENNVLLNNRPFVNNLPFDLNLVQSESVDSIEIINLPRGFLYSINNDPVAVNFIDKDFLSASPYSRIKYYQGPFGKAFFDMLFNTKVIKRLNFFLDISNRKGDKSYQNSTFGIWQATARLKYLFSNKLNITGSYKYNKSDAALNGGISIDSIALSTSDIKSLLYNEIKAPVNSLTGSQNELTHNFMLTTLWQPDSSLNTDFKVYHLFDQTRILNYSGDSTENKYKNYTYGASLNQTWSAPYINLKFTGSYEKTDYSIINYSHSVNIQELSKSENHLSLAAVFSFYAMDSTLVPSIFYKYSRNHVFNYFEPGDMKYDGNSIGFDINYLLSGSVKLYLGGSSFKQLFFAERSSSFEAGINYNTKDLYADLRIFSLRDFYVSYYDTEGLSGVGLKLNYYLWKILFENTLCYYFDQDLAQYYYLQKYNLTSGIYFSDILFNSNLDLKTGFRFLLSDNGYDAFFSGSLSAGSPAASLYSSSNYRLDFTLSGEIRKAAIVYFTWENLTGNQYFIVPFYPMPARNIRFGVAWELFN